MAPATRGWLAPIVSVALLLALAATPAAAQREMSADSASYGKRAVEISTPAISNVGPAAWAEASSVDAARA